MDKDIKNDLFRHGGLAGIKGFIKAYLFIPGFRYMYYFRKNSRYKKYSLIWWYYFLILRRHSLKYGFQIPPNTKIGTGFYIGHFGTIVINGKAIIGKNCNIAHGVTIGQSNRGQFKGYPTIGDFVWIGTGSVIVGNVTIESNVLIAPNTYVNFNVPSNSLVIGNPGKIIPRDNPCKDYINNIV